jgi:regulator of replication initiation timing
MYLSDMHLLECQNEMWTWKQVKPQEPWLDGRIFHTTCCVCVYPLLCIVIGGWARGRPDGAAYIVDVEKGIAHRIDLHDPRGSHSACCQVVSETSANIFVFGGCTNDFKDLYNVISNFRVYSWNRSASLSIKQILPENYIPDHPLEATQLLPTAEKNDRKDEDASSCKQTHDTHVSSENEQLLAEVQQLRRSLSESVMEKEALTAANERLVSQVSELTEERVKSNAENGEVIGEGRALCITVINLIPFGCCMCRLGISQRGSMHEHSCGMLREFLHLFQSYTKV